MSYRADGIAADDEIVWERHFGHPLPHNAPEHVCALYQHVADAVGTWKDAPTFEHRMVWNQARDAVIGAMLDYVLDAEQRLGAQTSARWHTCDRAEAIRQCEDRRRLWDEDQATIETLQSRLAAAKTPAIRADASQVLDKASEELLMLARQLRGAGF